MSVVVSVVHSSRFVGLSVSRTARKVIFSSAQGRNYLGGGLFRVLKLQGPKNSVGCKSSFPFPPFLLSPSYPLPSLPLRSRHPQLRLGGLGSAVCLSVSPAAKRILTHFRHKFAPFEYLMQLTAQ